ncbi:MAG: hypothetical protein ACC657_03480, partial [Thiohalomonadales bacterium]
MINNSGINQVVKQVIGVIIVSYFLLCSLAASATPIVDDYVKVTRVEINDVLNVREKPDWKSKKIAEISFDAICLKNLACTDGYEFNTEQKKSNSKDSEKKSKLQRWCKIVYGNKSGWVLAHYLTSDGKSKYRNNNCGIKPGFTNPDIKHWSYSGKEYLNTVNDIIQKASLKGKSWVQNPEYYLDEIISSLYKLNGVNEDELSTEGDGPRLFNYRFDSLAQPDYLLISDMQYYVGGDDSIGGSVTHYVFQKISYKFGTQKEEIDIWKMLVSKNAWRCGRGENT